MVASRAMSARKNAPPPALDSTPFGRALAERVCDHLLAGGRVLNGWNAHWLTARGDALTYEVLKDQRRVVFSTRDRGAFTDWLAARSAASLDANVRGKTTDTIEVIDARALRDAVESCHGVADKTPYGESLAARVADALRRGATIANGHRDYGGMGLFRIGGEYLYAEVYDGQPSGDPPARFTSGQDFVAWLAAQSDASLRGDPSDPFTFDNQRVTRARLVDAVRTSKG